MAERQVDPDGSDLEARWEAIRARMEAVAGVLVRQGSIASRLTGGGTRVFSLRYVEPGERRQRAIYLGREGELVCRARMLLAAYREWEALMSEVEEAARFAMASAAAVRHWSGPGRGRRYRSGSG